MTSQDNKLTNFINILLDDNLFYLNVNKNQVKNLNPSDYDNLFDDSLFLYDFEDSSFPSISTTNSLINNQFQQQEIKQCITRLRIDEKRTVVLKNKIQEQQQLNTIYLNSAKSQENIDTQFKQTEIDNLNSTNNQKKKPLKLHQYLIKKQNEYKCCIQNSKNCQEFYQLFQRNQKTKLSHLNQDIQIHKIYNT